MHKTSKQILGAFALVLSLAGPLAAGPLEDAFVAFDNGDYGTALRILRPLAEEGDARAQVKLGTMYTNGYGVPQDRVEAAKWYRKAAEQGDPLAQTVLGLIYDQALGVPQDLVEAAKWYRKAAEQGAALAQYKLGFLHEMGYGVARDLVEALMWYSLAAARAEPVDRQVRDQALHHSEQVAARMTAEEIAEAEMRAREWAPAPQVDP